MNKYIAILLTGIFCLSCATVAPVLPKPDGAGEESPVLSLEELFDGGHWVTTPSGTGLTVLGIAGRQRNRDDAITAALADAARRAALYHGVYGESATVLNQGSGNLDYFSDFDYKLDLLNNAENYISDLVFDPEKDVLEKNGVVIVRAQYAGSFGVPAYNPVIEDGVPTWVNNYSFEIPGFLTGINFSKKQGSPQKTYQASYENAIISLLPRLSTKSSGEIVDVTGAKLTRDLSVSSGTLENIMILETWLDKKTEIVWTLLVAKQKQE
jgi:hypothetical protein